MTTIGTRVRALSGALFGRASASREPSDSALGVSPYPAVRHLLDWAERPVIFDVGANDGRTVDQLKAQFPSARILAFEPVAATFRTMTERTRHFRDVLPFQLALGAEPKEQTIYLHPMASMNSFAERWGPATGTEVVTVSTVDVVMAEQALDFVHFLKIDTEGFELEVLKGAAGALARQQIAVVQVEAGFDPRVSPHTPLFEIARLLMPHGYILHGIFNQTRRSKGLRRPDRWPADRGAQYQPSGMKYCDALFVAAAHGEAGDGARVGPT